MSTASEKLSKPKNHDGLSPELGSRGTLSDKKARGNFQLRNRIKTFRRLSARKSKESKSEGDDSESTAVEKQHGGDSIGLSLSWEELIRNILIVLIHRMAPFWGTLASTLNSPEEILVAAAIHLIVVVSSYWLRILDDPKRPEKRQQNIGVLLSQWFSSFILRGVSLGLLWWQFSPEVLPKGLTRFMWVMRYHSVIKEVPGLLHSLAEIFFCYERQVVELPLVGRIKSVSLRLGQVGMALLAFLDWRYSWGVLCNQDVYMSMALAFMALGAQPLQIFLFASRDSGTNFSASSATIVLGLLSSVLFIFTISFIVPMYFIDESYYSFEHIVMDATSDANYEEEVLQAASQRLPFGRERSIPDCERVLKLEDADFRFILNLYTGWNLCEMAARDVKVVMGFLRSCDLSHLLVAQVYHRYNSTHWYSSSGSKSFTSSFSWANFFSEVRQFIGYSKDYFLPFSAAVTAIGFRFVNAISKKLDPRLSERVKSFSGGLVGRALVESTRDLFNDEDLANSLESFCGTLDSCREEDSKDS